MLAKRIIPCLDVTAGRVVKGINFMELRDAGDPVEIAALIELWKANWNTTANGRRAIADRLRA